MTFSQLLTSLGETLGLELVEEGGATALEIDGITIVLQEASDDGILLTHADLGEVPLDRREALAAAALEANYLYQGTGGSTLALDRITGHLHLQRYNWLDRTSPQEAIEALDHFAETATLWQTLLTSPLREQTIDDGAGNAPANDLALSGNYMRM